MRIGELDRRGPPAREVRGLYDDSSERRGDDVDEAGLHAWWHPLVPPWETVPWSSMVLLSLLLAHPLALVGELDGPTVTRIQTAASMSLLLQNVGVLGAAIVLKYAWGISRNPACGWLSVILSLVAVQNLPFALLAVAGRQYVDFSSFHGPTAIVVSIAVIAMLALALSGRDVPGPNPLLIGMPAGATIAAGGLVLVANDLDPALRGTPVTAALVQVLGFLIIAVVLVAILYLDSLPLWARVTLVAVVALLSVGLNLPGGPSSVGTVTHLWCGLVGVTLLLGTAITLLRATTRVHAQESLSLGLRLADAEAQLRLGKERMHELHSVIAGVTSATQLLLHDGVPDGPRRARMQELLDLEIERLGRMLDHRLPGVLGSLAVDDVLTPLVAIQRQRGRTLTWKPTGEVARGVADDLAEVIHILLDNAERHAPGSPVDVAVSRSDGRIGIVVSDRGPGIEPALRHTLFAWGVRDARTPGQGVGLQLARRLMVEQGGDLQLVHRGRGRGAAFRVTLPAAVPAQMMPASDTAAPRGAEEAEVG